MCKWQADYDGPMPSFFNDVERKARKPHTCDECDGAIKPGQVYRYISGLWDGYISQYHICGPCAETIEAFAAAHDEERPSLQGLSYALEECIEEETIVGDEETLTEAGQRWKKALDEMHARRAARGAA
jgi:ribosomal protein L37AE/L43A